MTSDRDLEVRIAELEWRLDQYHEHLEDALDHDREFQLKATWGIVTSVSGMFAVAALIWIVNKIGFDGWVWAIVVGVGSLFAFGAGAMWADRGRDDDLKKLSRLPKWRPDQP